MGRRTGNPFRCCHAATYEAAAGASFVAYYGSSPHSLIGLSNKFVVAEACFTPVLD